MGSCGIKVGGLPHNFKRCAGIVPFSCVGSTSEVEDYFGNLFEHLHFTLYDVS